MLFCCNNLTFILKGIYYNFKYQACKHILNNCKSKISISEILISNVDIRVQTVISKLGFCPPVIKSFVKKAIVMTCLSCPVESPMANNQEYDSLAIHLNQKANVHVNF